MSCGCEDGQHEPDCVKHPCNDKSAAEIGDINGALVWADDPDGSGKDCMDCVASTHGMVLARAYRNVQVKITNIEHTNKGRLVDHDECATRIIALQQGLEEAEALALKWKRQQLNELSRAIKAESNIDHLESIIDGGQPKLWALLQSANIQVDELTKELSRHKPVDDRAFDLAGEVPSLQAKRVSQASEIAAYREALEQIRNDGGPDFDADDMALCARYVLALYPSTTEKN